MSAGDGKVVTVSVRVWCDPVIWGTYSVLEVLIKMF